MIVEFRGVGFKNKGAELMLYAMRQQIQAAFPNAICVMEKNQVYSNKSLKNSAYFLSSTQKSTMWISLLWLQSYQSL